MRRWLARPVEIAAEQWWPPEDPRHVKIPEVRYLPHLGKVVACVQTAAGDTLPLHPGDWVIQEPGRPGRAYPCPADVFQAKYDPMVNTPP